MDGDRCRSFGIGCCDVYSRDILVCGDGRICPISVLARESGLRLWELSTSSSSAQLREKTEEVLSVLFDIGVVASWGDPLRLLKGLDPSRLARRASSRSMTRELVLISGSSLIPRTRLGLGRATSVEVVSLLPGRGLRFSLFDISSVSAIQISVRLRHMLSAFRRNCRSIVLAGPTTDAVLGEAPCDPALPVIAAKLKASDAVASKARYRFAFTTGLALASAERRSGCKFVIPGVFIVEASGEILPTCRRFGDDEIVVMVVVAVGGRSFRTVDIAAFDDFGSIPVSSSLRNRDFRSSNSSQTVDGAVVETVDSVSAV